MGGHTQHPAAALADIATPVGPREGICPTSTVYINDFCGSAPPAWAEVLVKVGERVFEMVGQGVKEKKSKLEGPAVELQLLGFSFSAGTGRL